VSTPKSTHRAAKSLLIGHIDAVLFDLDGVVTDTASLHAEAWKQTFDAVLQAQEGNSGAQELFDVVTDYRTYVDGRPRVDGARAFLTARHLCLPDGYPTDSPSDQTVWALANQKNETFQSLLADKGVRIFASSVLLLRRLRTAGVLTGLVTASRNAGLILAAAGIGDLFDAVVDGQSIAKLGLPGKPDPATYLDAARRLNVPPERAVVIEDALAGIEAGRRGGFGLIIGVDRTSGHGEELVAAGAHIVVSDLSELPVSLRS
jgi:beta-phosphoglucomutase family hydrolase